MNVCVQVHTFCLKLCSEALCAVPNLACDWCGCREKVLLACKVDVSEACMRRSFAGMCRHGGRAARAGHPGTGDAVAPAAR